MRIVAKTLALFVLFVSFVLVYHPAPAHAQEVPVQCIGEALAEYMNEIIDGVDDLDNVRLLSPAFNITNPVEGEIFDVMQSSGANFSQLDGYAGNTYSLFFDTLSNSIGAYQFYQDNFASRFSGLPVVFTEFGDFATGNESFDRTTVINRMENEFNLTQADDQIIGINYFNALQPRPEFTNPQFDFHNLSDAELQQIISSNPEKSGLNSALFVANGGFQNVVGELQFGIGWTVEIVGSRGNLGSARNAVNAADANGMNAVFRACVGDTCDFTDPAEYIAFIRELANSVCAGCEFWVIAGPNEPATEGWAAPNCELPEREYELEEVPCNGVTDPEFHSLRPYPASPCDDDPIGLLMCSNSLIAKEVFEVTRDDAVSCNEFPDGSALCTFIINSSVNIDIGLTDGELPIMGNTEDVPNAIRDTGFDFAQRVNEYVSWYLNGTIKRAEEDYLSILTVGSEDLFNLINFAGPIRKLYPRIGIQGAVSSGQAMLRKTERNEGIAGDIRHNQIVACIASGGTPSACYRTPSNPVRMSDMVSTTPDQPTYPYIPYSSTEDRVGEGETEPLIEIAQPQPRGVVISNLLWEPANEKSRLYFAHMQESRELGEILQRNFIPMDQVGTLITGGIAPALGGGDTFFVALPPDEVGRPGTPDGSVEPPDIGEHCEIIETRTNPGDKLYGDLQRNPEEEPISGVTSYTATFECLFSPPEIDIEGYNGCVSGGGNPDECTEENTTDEEICQRESLIAMTVDTTTPWADDVWERLVAGGMSFTRRIFPFVGPGSTFIEQFKDIPAESKANYTSSNAGAPSGPPYDQGIPSTDVLESNDTFAGDFRENRPGSSAKLFFPHIGSVLEYSLYGVQDALRPLGARFFVEEGDEEIGICGITCDLDSPTPPAPYASLKPVFVDLATRQTAGQGKNLAEECYNYVVNESLARGVNPSFTLAMWLHESAASNYGPSCIVRDFGITGSGTPATDVAAQLEAFLDIAVQGVQGYAGTYGACYSQETPTPPQEGLDAYPSNQNDFIAWMYVFQSGLGPAGDCSTLSDNYYRDVLTMFWWLAPQCTFDLPDDGNPFPEYYLITGPRIDEGNCPT